jgi:hypothetical protein
MIKKDYYRLDDLKHRFNMTEADILYLLEQRLVKACFYVDSTEFVIGGWSNKGFIGYAHVRYRGLINLPEEELQKLLRAKKVTPMNYLLANDKNIELSSSEYELELATPNNYIYAWKAKAPAEISWDFIPARLGPYVTETFLHAVQKTLNMCLEQQTKSTALDPSLEKYRNLPAQKLTAHFKTFLFSEICIRHQDLVSCKVISDKAESVPDDLPVSASAMSQELKGTCFENLITRIFMSDRTLSAKSVFKILAYESSLEEDSRHFDIENILLDHIDDIIIWKDYLSKSTEKRCSLATLGNKLTNIRKTVRAKE